MTSLNSKWEPGLNALYSGFDLDDVLIINLYRAIHGKKQIGTVNADNVFSISTKELFAIIRTQEVSIVVANQHLHDLTANESDKTRW